MPIKEVGKVIEKRVKNIFSKMIGVVLGQGAPVQSMDIKKFKTVIVFRPDRLGDFILSVPAIKTIEASLSPGARLVIVTGNRGGEGKKIARLFFEKTEIISVDKNLFSFLAVMGYLLINHFDAAIDLHSYPFSMTSGMFTIASRAKVRVGFVQTGEKNEALAEKIYNQGVVLTDNNVNEKEKNMLLALALGAVRNEAKENEALTPHLSEVVKAKAKTFYATCGITEKDFVVGIHPTLKKKDNRWEQEKYKALIIELKKNKNAVIVVVYGKGEDAELESFKKITADMDGVFIIPENDIMSTLAYAVRFNVFVCNDSGLMHTIALVAPTIAIFGPTSPERWKPAGKLLAAIRAQDHNPASVTVKDILKFI